ncbi:MAG: hypothetical protein FWC11_06955 [Firmicutes bacterium]|nr:hypothetical protein [Bacillota bacterium]
MKKRILKLVMVAVMMFIAVVPMMGCEREMTLEEYRLTALQALNEYLTSEWENFHPDYRLRVNGYLFAGRLAINSANSKEGINIALNFTKRLMCKVPRIPRFYTYVQTDYFRLTLYIDRNKACQFFWITSVFENISDVDFYITSNLSGTGFEWHLMSLNALSLGWSVYDVYGWHGNYRSEMFKSGAKIINTHMHMFEGGLAEGVIFSTMADFATRKTSSDQSENIVMRAEIQILTGEN